MVADFNPRTEGGFVSTTMGLMYNLRLRPPAPAFEVAVATVGDPPASPGARSLLAMLRGTSREEPR